MMKGAGSPTAAFVRFRTDLLAQVKGGDVAAVMGHELLAELAFLRDVLEQFIVYDQIQVHNLAGGELMLRR
eukprot:4011176-Lingulodinium_polyedra.AAC.1